MLNQITIMGRLTKDPEIRTTTNGKMVASFTVAVDRDFSQNKETKETDFIDCTAWGGTAQFVERYIHKGSMVVAKGDLRSRKWDDKNGNHRVNWFVNADHVYFGEPKKTTSPDVPYDEVGDEEELPW